MKILHPSNDSNDSHEKAIRYISEFLNKDYWYVYSIVSSFFGKWGLKYFIKRNMKISIRNFGDFYFHKKISKNREKLLDESRYQANRKYYYKSRTELSFFKKPLKK